MAFLLKITDGLMRGAEVALISGTRVTVGSSEECDIVLPDSTVPSKVCELDVSEGNVAVILSDGSVKRLEPFRIFAVGDGFSFAIGPEDGEWEELKPAEVAPVETAAAEQAENAAEEEEEENGNAETSQESTGAGEAGDGQADDGVVQASSGGHGLLWAILVIVVLLMAVAVYLWFWTPECLKERRECISESICKLFGKGDCVGGAVMAEPVTLEKLASDYGLELTKDGGKALLKGNFTLRTERLAVRALALAADRTVRLDLTDDETIRAGAQALAYTVCGTGVTVSEVSNRRVTLGGKVRDERELASLQEAFRNDLPCVEALDVSGVQVGAVAVPVSVPPQVAAVPKTQEASTAVKAASAVPFDAATAPAVAPSSKFKLPVAGILTVPYRCVVLQNGVRCVEGAKLGGAILEKIEADRLTLRFGSKVIVWVL